MAPLPRRHVFCLLLTVAVMFSLTPTEAVVEQLTLENSSDIVDIGLPLLVAFTNVGDAAQSAAVREVLDAVAAEYPGIVTPVWADHHEFSDQMDRFRIVGKTPSLVIDTLSRDYYIYKEGAITVEQVAKWIVRFANKRLISDAPVVKKKKLTNDDVVDKNNKSSKDTEDDLNAPETADVAGSLVHKLTPKNFQEFINTHDKVILMIFFPGNVKYKGFRDTYEALAKEYHSKGLTFARLNAVVYKKFYEDTFKDGTAMPGLIAIRNHTVGPYLYTGNINLKDVTMFLDRHAGAGYMPLDSISDIMDFVEEDSYITLRVVGVFNKSTDTKESEKFIQLANNNRDKYLFGLVYVTDDTIPEFRAYFAGHQMSVPAVFLHRTIDKAQVQFKGSLFNDSEFDKFIKNNDLPLIGEITKDKMGPWTSKGLPLVVTFVDSDKDNEPLFQELREVAAGFVGQALFMWGDGVVWRHQMERLGMSHEHLPAVGIDSLKGQDTHAMRVPFSGENVYKFVRKFVDGKLKPLLTSEDRPTSQDDDLYKVVGSTLVETVLREDKHVFMMYHVEWCPHCTKLLPIFKEVGRKAKKMFPDVLCGEMNVSKNQMVPGINVQSFPSLIFHRLGKKDVSPISYKGEQKVAEILEWIKLAREGKAKEYPDQKEDETKPKQQEKPLKNDGPVTVVVRDTFDEIVKDRTKDVLLEFYAPWCGHCKSLAPEYEALATRTRKIRNLVIAKYDGDANIMPEGIEIKGFPTIMFFTRTTKDKPIEYHGKRVADAMFKFVNEHRVGRGDKDEV